MFEGEASALVKEQVIQTYFENPTEHDEKVSLYFRPEVCWYFLCGITLIC